MSESKHIASLNHDRIFGFDILRACAIIFVVAVHGRFLVEGTFLYDFPYLIFADGVDLFFVLSGFLIGTILLKEISTSESFTFSQLTNFWKRRWFRTLPNYYLILLVNVIIVKYNIINEDINQFNWKFLFFLQNFKESFYGFFWESWSLSIEEWFYIFAPIILLILIKLLPAKKAFLTTVLILILTPIFFRFFKESPAQIDWNWLELEIKKSVLTRLDSIGYGLLAAWTAFYYRDFFRKYKIHFLILAIVFQYVMANYNFNNNTFYLKVMYFSLMPMTAMFFLPIGHSIKQGSGYIAKMVTHISKISYSMYLVNLAIVAEVINCNFPKTSVNDGILKYVLYWAIVIVLSSIIYRFFEKPMMNLRNKF
jgi:peptidoglycan/LPS O-acetylase OafA/YrhL